MGCVGSVGGNVIVERLVGHSGNKGSNISDPVLQAKFNSHVQIGFTLLSHTLVLV